MRKEYKKQLTDSLKLIKDLDILKAKEKLNGFNFDAYYKFFDFDTKNTTATIKETKNGYEIWGSIELYDNNGYHVKTLEGFNTKNT